MLCVVYFVSEQRGYLNSCTPSSLDVDQGQIRNRRQGLTLTVSLVNPHVPQFHHLQNEPHRLVKMECVYTCNAVRMWSDKTKCSEHVDCRFNYYPIIISYVPDTYHELWRALRCGSEESNGQPRQCRQQRRLASGHMDPVPQLRSIIQFPPVSSGARVYFCKLQVILILPQGCWSKKFD